MIISQNGTDLSYGRKELAGNTGQRSIQAKMLFLGSLKRAYLFLVLHPTFHLLMTGSSRLGGAA